MEYKIEMPEFEGPLDLLLHFIKESNIDICDIRIEVITNQYLDYIHKMEEMNLNIASEYLVMAAELLEIKSSSLLPKKQSDLTDEYEDDPRDQLIQRLLEYERYKNITSSLRDFEQQRQEFFGREPSNLEEFQVLNEGVHENFSLDDLMSAFLDALKRQEINKPLNTKVTNREYSVSERSSQIRDILKKYKKVEFTELFDIYTRDYLVVTFLSILDLARKQELSIEQDDNFKKIFLESKGM